MVTYRAMFKFVEGGVHAEVLDFPGVITCGATLDEARALLQGALVDLAEITSCTVSRFPRLIQAVPVTMPIWRSRFICC